MLAEWDADTAAVDGDPLERLTVAHNAFLVSAGKVATLEGLLVSQARRDNEIKKRDRASAEYQRVVDSIREEGYETQILTRFCGTASYWGEPRRFKNRPREWRNAP